MSWLRDPDSGEMAGTIDAAELKRLQAIARRQPQRAGWHWVVVRDEAGHPTGLDLQPVPKDQKGLSLDV